MRWIDACCGIGGFRLGFERAGWPPPLLAFDVDERLADFYAQKFEGKGGEVIAADIFDVSESPGAFGLWPGRVELVVCGAPCQPFSHANIKNRKGEPACETADPRLFVPFAACELAAKLQADFVIENVLGMLDLWGGEWFARFLAFCEAHGFAVGWTYMDCSDYGTPSKRGHLLLFGAYRGARVAGGPGPVLAAFAGGSGEETFPLCGRGPEACLPLRLVSGRHPFGYGSVVLCEVLGEKDFRLRSFGLREMEFLLGFPLGYTEELPRCLAEQALADAFPPPAAEALGRMLMEAFRAAL